METIIATIIDALPALASAAVIALCGYAWNKLKGFRGEHMSLVAHLQESDDLKSEVRELKRGQEPQNAVLRELMGDMLDREHGRLVDQGYASPAEKAAFERKYKAYHGIRGNGTRTALYEDVLKMNSYPTT